MESSKTIYFIKLKLKQLEKIEEGLKKVIEEIAFLDTEIINKEKENKEILTEIEEIKKNPEHLEILKLQEKASTLKKELEKDIFSLGQIVDFRALGNFYHIFEDKMEILKSHRNDFTSSFLKDNGKNITSLLENAKLNNKIISDKFDQINKKKEEVSKLEIYLEVEKSKDKTNELYLRNTKIAHETENLKERKTKAERRLRKLSEEKEEAVKEVKVNIEKFGAELK